jgi:hypothetical protein
MGAIWRNFNEDLSNYGKNNDPKFIMLLKVFLRHQNMHIAPKKTKKQSI